MSSGQDLAKKFSEFAGRKDQYDVREVEGVDGTKQTQLIDKDTGSISFAWDGDLPEDLDTIIGSVGGDPAVMPKEAVEDNKRFETSRGVLATPTQPEALEGARDVEEIDNSKAFKSENQESKVTDDMRSAPERRKK